MDSFSPSNTALLSAPLWRICAANVYDFFLVAALWLSIGLLNLVIQLGVYGSTPLMRMIESGYVLDGLGLYGTLLVTTYGFFMLFWSRSGQTPGMKAWRIIVLNQQQQLLSPAQCLIRFSTALFTLGLGNLWRMINCNSRSLQDVASKTYTTMTAK